MKTKDIEVGKTYIVSSQRSYVHDRVLVKVLATGQPRRNVNKRTYRGLRWTNDGVVVEKVEIEGLGKTVHSPLVTQKLLVLRHIDTGEEILDPRPLVGYEEVGGVIQQVVRPQEVVEQISPEDFVNRLAAEKKAKDERVVQQAERLRERTERMERIEAALTEAGLMVILLSKPVTSKEWIDSYERKALIQGTRSLSMTLGEVALLRGFEVPQELTDKPVDRIDLDALEALVMTKVSN